MGDFMQTLSLMLVLSALAFQSAGHTPPTQTDVPLTIDQVLHVASVEQLLTVAGERAKTLLGLLSKATDEESAREILPAARRCYLEISLVDARLGMLPPPTDQDRARLAPFSDPVRKTQSELNRQVQRIQESPGLLKILEPVTRQFHVEQVARSNAIANMLRSELQTVRAQIELYALQHNDNRPDFRKQGWSQLTKATRGDGTTAEGAEYGPYLRTVPTNPLVNRSRILISRSTPKKDFHYAGGDCGFVFDESTGRFWALDADGHLYKEGQSAEADIR
jgi:hypothetical protein